MRADRDPKRAWTKTDYERVRAAVIAMIGTHMPQDCGNGTIRASFDGRLYWELLGALDRTDVAQANRFTIVSKENS